MLPLPSSRKVALSLRERRQEQGLLGDATGTEPPKCAEGTELSEDDQKVIVRSNGTVGYVGKDIAYHMWKFGLLGRDFGYRKFYATPPAWSAGSQPRRGKGSSSLRGCR